MEQKGPCVPSFSRHNAGVAGTEYCVLARTSRGTRLAIREARLITAELRRLGVPPRAIAKIWAVAIGVPVVCVIGYLAFNYDFGTADPTILKAVQITYQNDHTSHVTNNSRTPLKTLTFRCSPGGDAQPRTSLVTLYPPLEPSYGEDVYISGNCSLIRANESHQLW